MGFLLRAAQPDHGNPLESSWLNIMTWSYWKINIESIFSLVRFIIDTWTFIPIGGQKSRSNYHEHDNIRFEILNESGAQFVPGLHGETKSQPRNHRYFAKFIQLLLLKAHMKIISRGQFLIHFWHVSRQIINKLWLGCVRSSFVRTEWAENRTDDLFSDDSALESLTSKFCYRYPAMILIATLQDTKIICLIYGYEINFIDNYWHVISCLKICCCLFLQSRARDVVFWLLLWAQVTTELAQRLSNQNVPSMIQYKNVINENEDSCRREKIIRIRIWDEPMRGENTCQSIFNHVW